MIGPKELCLLTVSELAQGNQGRLTCLVFDQDIFSDLRILLKKIISEDQVWHIIVVGNRSSDVEDEIDNIIVSVTTKLVMTSSVGSYDFDEILSLATMAPERGGSVRKIAYVYDDAQPKLREIAQRLVQEVSGLS